MKRREFIARVGRASIVAMMAPATTVRRAAAAEQKIYRIGILSGLRRPSEPVLLKALEARGYVEGRNVFILSRNAEGEPSRLPALAAELIGLKPDVIIAAGGPAAEALKATTATIPIVLWGVGDAVGLGLITNVAHPGGNITGVTELSTELTPKRLQLLKETVPNAKRIAILWNATDRSMDLRAQEAVQVAPALGITMIPLPVHDGDEIDAVLAALAKDPPDAVMVVTDPMTLRKQRMTLEFLASHGLASMYEFSFNARAGALMSYGPDFADIAPVAADYVDRILKGANPGALPVESPTRYYLLVNRKTATQLGITVPTGILIRADEVIE
jgi:putative ABC transport system substrate-binding protein